MAFAGHMMIELIQPKDNERSVYKETIDQRGYGFHHLGIAVSEVEAERAACAKRGYHVAFSAPVPSGGTVHGRDVHPLLESLARLEGREPDSPVRLARFMCVQCGPSGPPAVCRARVHRAGLKACTTQNRKSV